MCDHGYNLICNAMATSDLQYELRRLPLRTRHDPNGVVFHRHPPFPPYQKRRATWIPISFQIPIPIPVPVKQNRRAS
ncbi:hypothetical protein RchiOBHm_Chr4g0393881 [Rosa chinensis]|uniref:Uncharacterized protein n=1 Tax=Rosa chinensis TaxID=74649 RepID=A0A2P6QR33_ROSCH|nr:hypothetical protein RchiOBHm_Chr4g0393881 [Rosa chinensis]